MVAGTTTMRMIGGVEGDGDGETEAEHLDLGGVAEHEGCEDADHDERGGGDHAGRSGDASDHAAGGVAGGDPLLADTGEDEDLVVHGEAEEDGEHHHRQERHDGHGLVEADGVEAPSPLEHRDERTVGSGDAQQVDEGGLERDQR
jgi:hypothetical protein